MEPKETGPVIKRVPDTEELLKKLREYQKIEEERNRQGSLEEEFDEIRG